MNEQSELNSDQTKELSRNYVAEVQSGAHDFAIVSAFRCNHFDLRQFTSGVRCRGRNTVFHKLARFVGLPGSDDVALSLYRALLINKRGLRDQIEQCECCRGKNHYFAKPVTKDEVDYMSMLPIYKIFINDQYEKDQKPPSISSIKKHRSTLKIFRPTNISVNKYISKENVSSPIISPSIESIEYLSEHVNRPKLKLVKLRKYPTNISGNSPYLVSGLTVQQIQETIDGKTVLITCPQCGNYGITKIKYKIGSLSLKIIIFLTILCCIPCVLSALIGSFGKDYIHTCGNCHFIFGTVKNGIWQKTVEWNYEGISSLEGEIISPSS